MNPPTYLLQLFRLPVVPDETTADRKVGEFQLYVVLFHVVSALNLMDQIVWSAMV